MKSKTFVTAMSALAFSVIAATALAANRGVESGSGQAAGKGEACQAAKDKADVNVSTNVGLDATVVRHSRCDCSKDEDFNGPEWSCTVDAYWERKSSDD